ncbi:hypothetical protein BGY98DRAFT_93546 [Russula aff. rugulosa BPL654]|nr:hypothetical protein BGY98DRAFT_93546 [Russula aff. rugulosa BPL654]
MKPIITILPLPCVYSTTCQRAASGGKVLGRKGVRGIVTAKQAKQSTVFLTSVGFGGFCCSLCLGSDWSWVSNSGLGLGGRIQWG